MERALHDMTMAFIEAGHRVDISAPREKPGTWGVDPDCFHRVPRWRTRGVTDGASGWRPLLLRAARPVRRVLSPHYDLHIGFRWTRNINPLIRADRHWVNPSGNVMTWEDFADYDAVAMQAPGNTIFLPDTMPRVLLPPPLRPLATRCDEVAGLPDQYVLSVFNSARDAKGGVDLATLVEQSPLPVVWCTGAASPNHGVPDNVLRHPNLITLREPSREQLRFLYEHAFAYVSLSISEGFGWAVADALRYTPRVVSRRVGVMSFDEALQPGVTLLDDTLGAAGLDWEALSAAAAPTVGRDLDWLSSGSFCRRVQTLLG